MRSRRWSINRNVNRGVDRNMSRCVYRNVDRGINWSMSGLMGRCGLWNFNWSNGWLRLGFVVRIIRVFNQLFRESSEILVGVDKLGELAVEVPSFNLLVHFWRPSNTP